MNEAYDPSYGARPLQHFLEAVVVTRISRMLIAGEVKRGSVVNISTDGLGKDLTYAVVTQAKRRRKLDINEHDMMDDFGSPERPLDRHDSWDL